MPGTIANYAVRKGPQAPPRRLLKRWTRAEYEHFVNIGAFTPEDRIELLNGEIVTKMSHNPPHSVSLNLTKRVLMRLLEEKHDLFVQLPLALGLASEPEPDLAVVAGDPRDFLEGHPTHALLVVEVANTSLALDRGAKSSIYAESGIPEYWIVNVRDLQLEVRRNPSGTSFESVQILQRGDSITPLFAPGNQVAVGDLLP